MAYQLNNITRLTNTIAVTTDPEQKEALTRQLRDVLQDVDFNSTLQAQIDKSPEAANALLSNAIGSITNAIAEATDPKLKVVLTRQLRDVLQSGNFNSTLQAQIDKSPEAANELLSNTIGSITNAIAEATDPKLKEALTRELRDLLQDVDFNSTLQAQIDKSPEAANALLSNTIGSITNAIAEATDPKLKEALTRELRDLLQDVDFNSTLQAQIDKSPEAANALLSNTIGSITNAIAEATDPKLKEALTRELRDLLQDVDFNSTLQAQIDKSPEAANALLSNAIGSITNAIAVTTDPKLKVVLTEQLRDVLQSGNFNSTLQAQIDKSPEAANALLSNTIGSITNAIAEATDPKLKVALTRQLRDVLQDGNFNSTLQAQIDKSPEAANALLSNTIGSITNAIAEATDPKLKVALTRQLSDVLQDGNFNSTLQAQIDKSPEAANALLSNAIGSITNAIAEATDPELKEALTRQLSYILHDNSTLQDLIPIGEDMVMLGDGLMLVNPKCKEAARADIYTANGAFTQISCTAVLAEEIGTTYQPDPTLLQAFVDNTQDITELDEEERRTYYITMRQAVMLVFKQQQTDPDFVLPKTQEEMLQLGAQELLKPKTA